MRVRVMQKEGPVLRFARLLATLSVLFLPAAAPATGEVGTIAGTVLDGDTRDPLFSALVLVTFLDDPPTTARDVSDRAGRFLLELPPGTYDLRVSFPGYATHVADSVRVEAGATIAIDIALAPSPREMETIIVSASRRKEKLLDAPASVQILDSEEMEHRTVLTPADHLQARRAIDVSRHGINQSTVVVRGFNNAFSGATLTLVDNRISRIPSLRYNALTMIPTMSEDYERVEVVSGPGSALYGPNAANGVVHILTRPPADRPRTSVHVTGGSQDVLVVSGRHAGVPSGRLAYKITAQYFRGTDFKYRDPVEEIERQDALDDGANPDTLRIGAREFAVRRAAMEGRIDVRLTDESELILNGGYNTVDNIELTGLGAAQAQNWAYKYGQVRLAWRKLFAQVYMNASDAGDTYLLRTGNRIVDQSKFIVGQVQHAWQAGPRQNFIYGLDANFTRPATGGTINGRNEDDDGIDEFGGYVQSETALHERWDLVLAARLDDHSQLDDPVLSPRAAVAYEPARNQKIRITYNRAFSTPTTNNLFLDLVVLEDLGGFGAATGLDGYDVFTQGVPKGGFTFRRDEGGGIDGLYMEIPEAFRLLVDPTSPRPPRLPADATRMWEEALRIAVGAGADPAILAIPAPGPGVVGSSLLVLNTTTGAFDPVPASAVRDIATLKPTTTSTLEVGWKGMVGSRISATADFYYRRIEDFMGPLRVETPNVFLEPVSLAAYLGNPAFGLSQQNAATLAGELARIPLGTVTPENSIDQAALLVTYRNFGDIDLSGVDLSMDWLVEERWTLGLTYSWVSKDFFEDVEGDIDVALNAPRNKVGIRIAFDDRDLGLRGDVRCRYIDAFPVESGVYLGRIRAYGVVDLGMEYDLPFSRGTAASLTVRNLLDKKHREFIGAPEVGVIALLRLSQDF